MNGDRRKDFEDVEWTDVECTDNESSAALELASSLLRSSACVLSVPLLVATIVSLLELYG